MKNTIRTFVAVEIEHAIRTRTRQLVQTLSNSPAKVKWVEPENLHLTLKFLGEVSHGLIADVCRKVEKAAAQVEPFTLEVCGLGAFPNPARPRVIWLGSRTGAEQMVLLYDRIEAALAELGFPRENRRFQVHLTIGRPRSGGQTLNHLGTLLKQHADFHAGQMSVEHVTVFGSTLTPNGPIYDVLGQAPLGG